MVLVRAFAVAAVVVVVPVGCGEVKSSRVDSGVIPGDGGDGGGGACQANQALRCEDNVLVSCNGDGTAETQTTCDLRCNATTLACENSVAPSNGYAAQLDAAATEAALNITTNTSFVLTSDFNSTNGTVKVGTQQVKAELVAGANGGPEVLVLSVNSLSVAATVKLTIFSESGSARQVAFISAGDVSIAGTIERGATGASGGNDPCFGASSNAAGADNDVPGGGGGGFGSVGANGGAVLTVATGAAGGTAAGNDTLVPLRPGCRGGNTAALGGGGSGGGAIQITSGSSITVSGAITAPGFGGTVNAGGGSGGAILLEAPSITISGGIYANGGAGGCGELTAAGNNGGTSSTPAVGGPCQNGLSGGSGGAGTTAPTNGDSVANNATSQYAPGGGGAVGRIRINTLDATIAGAGATSPPASLGAVGTRSL